MPKIISILGVVGAVALAIAAQLEAVNPKWGMLAMAVAAVASAAGGALSRFTGNYAVTALGLVVAISSALLGFEGLIGAGTAQVLAILGTAAAAAGKALWPEATE